jgi:hypothetical protein
MESNFCGTAKIVCHRGTENRVFLILLCALAVRQSLPDVSVAIFEVEHMSDSFLTIGENFSPRRREERQVFNFFCALANPRRGLDAPWRFYFRDSCSEKHT